MLVIPADEASIEFQQLKRCITLADARAMEQLVSLPGAFQQVAPWNLGQKGCNRRYRGEVSPSLRFMSGVVLSIPEI